MKPNWLKEESTRKQSGKQETKLAKKFNGKKFANSGARFGQNDIYTEHFEIEAKITKHEQYALKVEELKKLRQKTSAGRIPLEIIEFGNTEQYVVINLSDFLEMFE